MSTFNLSLGLSQFNIQISIKRIRLCPQKAQERLYQQYLLEQSIKQAEKHREQLLNSAGLFNRLY